jgi:hypothetical protein
MDVNQVRADRKCYNCGEKDHYANRCPNPSRRSLMQQFKKKEKIHLED